MSACSGDPKNCSFCGTTPSDCARDEVPGCAANPGSCEVCKGKGCLAKECTGTCKTCQGNFGTCRKSQVTAAEGIERVEKTAPSA